MLSRDCLWSDGAQNSLNTASSSNEAASAPVALAGCRPNMTFFWTPGAVGTVSRNKGVAYYNDPELYVPTLWLSVS